MKGGDSSPHHAGEPSKSSLPATPLPQDTKSHNKNLKIDSFFRWDHENSRNLKEEIDLLEEAIDKLINFEERGLVLDGIQFKVMRLYKNVLRCFYARVSTLSRVSELVHPSRGVNYSSNEAFILHLIEKHEDFNIYDVHDLISLKNIRDIRSFIDHPFSINGTYDWMTTATISHNKNTAVVVFFGYGKNKYDEGLKNYYRYMPDREGTQFIIQADWYITIPPLPIIQNAYNITESVRKFLIKLNDSSDNRGVF